MKPFLNNDTFQLVIFDLDGTFYSRDKYIARYYEFAIKAVCELLSLSEDKAKQYFSLEGITPDPATSTGSVSSLVEKLGIPKETWNNYRNEHFDVSGLISKNEQLVKVISEFKQYYRLVLFTNNTAIMTNKILKRLGLSKDLFEYIFTSDSNMGIKPYGDKVFYYLKDHTHVEFVEMLSIGDRYEVDIAPLLGLGGSGVLIVSPEELRDIIPLIFPERGALWRK
jgi:FMN phosphatase YigB (HAD superfamily)